MEKMTQKINKASICIFCANQEDCVLNRNSSIIYDCNEFEFSSNSQSVDTRFDIIDLDDDAEVKKVSSGLCVNCDHAHNCKRAHQKDVVYFCEEYE